MMLIKFNRLLKVSTNIPRYLSGGNPNNGQCEWPVQQGLPQGSGNKDLRIGDKDRYSYIQHNACQHPKAELKSIKIL